jgi:prefoldin subunit 5
MRFGGHAAPYQKPDPEMEKQALKNYTEELQSELDAIKSRLAEIETVPAEAQ